MATPRLYWHNFVVKDQSFKQLVDSFKQDPEHREFELRFGIPIRSRYDGIYDFNPNLGQSLFNKYREIFNRIKEPTEKKINISRKSVGGGVTIRNVDGVYSQKTSINKVDNLVSIKSSTNESTGDMRNLFLIRFALSQELPIIESKYNTSKERENIIQRVRYSYDFDQIIVDLTHDIENDNSASVYSLEIEYKNSFLNTIQNIPYINAVKVIFEKMKSVLNILFPDATDIYEYNTYRKLLEIGWGYGKDGNPALKILGRPINISRQDVPILYEGYAFTNKLNGVYFRLIISEYENQGTKYGAYLINDLEVKILTLNNPALQPFNKTVIDVELFKNSLWAFDCPVFQGKNNTMRSHNLRMAAIKPYIGKISSLIQTSFEIKNFIYSSDPVQGLHQILQYMYESFGESVDRDNDGIVMTPFGQYRDDYGNMREKTYYDFRYKTYKWKFPSTVSIDFLIKQIDQYDEGDITYKVFNLLAQDKNEIIQLKPFHSKSLNMDFNPPQVFRIDNRHRHYNDLTTGKIIEVTYDKESNSFVLYHIRSEKTRPNGINVAQDTFVDMSYEFSLKEFESLLKETREKPYIRPPKSKFTKVSDEKKSGDIQSYGDGKNIHCLKQYREYHNSVKRELIREYTSEKSVLDLGTGKGGDLSKYRDSNIKWLWAVEPFAENIENPDDGLYRRIQNIWHSSNFIKYTSTTNEIYKPEVPVMTIHAGAQDTDIIRRAMTRKIIENGKALDRADVITSFFSMSFFFSDYQMLNRVIDTITTSLEPGGYFIGTMMDGETTYNMLKENKGLIEEKDCYYIKRMYPTDQPLGMGNQIAVNLSGTPTVAGEQIEWLAPFHILEEILKYKNIKLISKYPLTDFQLSPAQKRLSSLYIGFVFKKLTGKEAEKDVSKRTLQNLQLGKSEKGFFISPEIYEGELYRTGATQEGSCFFSSLFLGLISSMNINIQEALSEGDIKKLTYIMRQKIGERITFSLYTLVNSTESTSKLLEAVFRKFKKLGSSRLEKIGEELTIKTIELQESKNPEYHKLVKNDLIIKLKALDPEISSEDIDKIDKSLYNKYIEDVVSPNEWANNYMFSMISIVTDTNIIIVKDNTRLPQEFVSCTVYNPENPYVIFINIGAEQGKHFEPVYILNTDGTKKFRFYFSDQIIQNIYGKICPNLLQKADRQEYYDTASKKQFTELIKHDFSRLSSLVYKATNSDKCVQILRQPFKDDLDILVKMGNCKVKGDTEGFMKGRQTARTRDVQTILREIKQLGINSKIETYLDFGGSDGAISSAITESLGISSKNSYSADIKEWFTRKINKSYKNISYISIIPETSLELPENSIDLITCFQVLHHIENIDFVLDDFYRVLKKGGVLIIREHNCENSIDRMLCDVEHTLYEITMESAPDMKYLDNYKAWYRSKSQWREIIQKHGFRFMEIKYPYKDSQTKYYYEAFIKV